MPVKKRTNIGDTISKFWEKNVWTGYNLAGLEFSGKRGGVAGIDYPDYIPKEYAKWASDNGINSYRLPIKIGRLIPGKGANNDYPANLAYAKIIKDFLLECEQYNIKVFLDSHDEGEYEFLVNGGFTSKLDVLKNDPLYVNLFSEGYQLDANNELMIKNYFVPSENWSFQTVIIGDIYNPTFPATGYNFKTTIRPVNTKNAGLVPNEAWEGIAIYAMYKDDNNHYEIYWNDANYDPLGQSAITNQPSAPLSLVKVKNGIRTTIATANVPFQTGLNVLHDFELDVNQTTLGSIIVRKDGINIMTAPFDSDLNQGQVGFRTLNSRMNVKSYQLDVNGDTVNGNKGIVELKWGKSGAGYSYDIAMHKKLYTTLHNEFNSFSALEGYMYNEPKEFDPDRGYTVSEITSPSTYKTTAVVTLFQQAALDQLRLLGSTKWFGWTSDNYAGIQNMAQGGTSSVKWGPDFDYPWVDPIDKTFIDLHYYTDKYSNWPAASFNFSHSGTYGAIGWQNDTNSPNPAFNSGDHEPFTRAETIQHVNSFVIRHNEINVARITANKLPIPMIISEVGSPYVAAKGALPGADYIKSLDNTLAILRANNVGFHYYAIGPTAPNDPTGLFCGIQTTTRVNNVDIVNLNITNNTPGNIPDPRHLTIFKHLNKK